MGIAIAALISGIASWWASREQGRAQTHATDASLQGQREALQAEQDAQRRAEALAREQRDYERAMDRRKYESELTAYNTWQQRNAPVLQALASRLHLPQGFSMASLAQPQGGMGTAGRMPTQAPMTTTAPATTGGMSLGAMAQPATVAAPASAPQTGMGQGVRMVSPTGEERVVPFHLVAQALRLGAQRLA